MRLEERYIHYVKNAINVTVGNTGYPVAGNILSMAGIATRKQLRELERRKHIKSVTVIPKEGTKRGQALKAYFTDEQLPKEFFGLNNEKEQETPSEQ